MPREVLRLLFAGALFMLLRAGEVGAQPAAQLPRGGVSLRLATAVAAREPEWVPRALAVQHAIDAALRRDPRVALVDLLERDRSAISTERRLKGEEGRTLLAEARAQLERGEPQLARRKAAEAVAALGQGELERDFGWLLDALAFQAYAMHHGNLLDAIEILSHLFTLAPGYQPDPALMKPAFAALVEDARGNVSFAPHATLEIEAGPGAGFVYVDGAFKGVTPVEVGGIAPGQHYVTVLSPGHRPVQAVASAGPGQSFVAKLEPSPQGIELRRWLGAVTAAYSGEQLAEVGTGLAGWAEAEAALLANLALRGGKVQVVAVLALPGAAVPRIASATFEASAEPAALARSILGLLEQAPLVPPPPPAASAAAPPSRGLDRRAFGFVALGTSAAAGVGGALLGFSAWNQVRGAELLPQVDRAAYERAYAGAQRTSLIANGLYVLSAAAAGGAAWLLLTSGPAAEPRPVSVGLTPVPAGGLVSLGGSF